MYGKDDGLLFSLKVFSKNYCLLSSFFINFGSAGRLISLISMFCFTIKMRRRRKRRVRVRVRVRIGVRVRVRVRIRVRIQFGLG
jgi:hypothetical protein